MYETVFMNGKQKRIRRAPTVDGLPVDEFIRRNADPIWLHQNEMWTLMEGCGLQGGLHDVAGTEPGAPGVLLQQGQEVFWAVDDDAGAVF